MKVFVAGILTETNTFAPWPTGMRAFEEMGIRRADGSGRAPLFQPACDLLQALAQKEGHVIVPGLLAVAQPGGPVVQGVYETLRDELLQGLRDAGPVDAVVLLLHGAMVAQRCADCEGDLLARVRGIVGPRVPIGAELDLHCHFTDRMRVSADVLVAYKEYPHTDVLDRLREVWRLTLDTASGRIRPVTAAFDCAMNGLWHTTREPMRTFVRDMQALEGRAGVLSVNFGHGFPWGDTEEAGAKVWVITDGDAALAARVAEDMGERLWASREAGRPPLTALEHAIDRVAAGTADKPVVLADVADNPGGGAAGDSTFILRALLDRSVGDVAVGALWDPIAVQACMEAGTGATLSLRVGGKCGPASGDPVDIEVAVQAVRDAHTQQGLGGSPLACGAAAWVRTATALDLVLISIRQQVYGRDIFTGLGIDLPSRRAIVVKSQQHFLAAFAPLASEVLYVDTPGLLRADLENIPYRHRCADQWPLVAMPARWTERGRGDVEFLPCPPVVQATRMAP